MLEEVRMVEIELFHGLRFQSKDLLVASLVDEWVARTFLAFSRSCRLLLHHSLLHSVHR
jgi:Integrase core domain